MFYTEVCLQASENKSSKRGGRGARTFELVNEYDEH